MALERKWPAIPARLLTADGNAFGLIQIADTAEFRTKQKIGLKSNTLSPTAYQVKEVISSTQLIVGPIDNKVGRENFSDVSMWTVADGATIHAVEQDKNQIPDKDHYLAVYESDPVVADRVILVDKYGNKYGEGNPLPIAFDGTVAVGNVTITDDGGDELQINSDGSINVVIVPSVSGNSIVRNKYGAVAGLAANTQTTVVSYTVPPGRASILQRAVASGENIAKYDVLINGIVQSTLRTYFAGGFNAEFEFTTGQNNGIVLEAGDVVLLRVIHQRPQLADFDGRIQIYEALVGP